MLVGLDGLSWADCRSAAQSGTVPHLARLINAGRAAPLVGAEFDTGPAAWTTLATGLPPEDHGVSFADEARCGGPGPASRRSWCARPWWEAAHDNGRSIASVAWPANGPADRLPGQQIDDSIARASGRDRRQWALPLHCASGPVRAALRGRRVHPTEIDAGLVARFVTDIGAIDQDHDPWLPHIAVALARAATIQAASVWALMESGASVVVLYQPWLADMRAAFGRCHDVNFAPALPTALAFLDDLIGRLVTLAGPSATVVLVSPNRGLDPGMMLTAGRAAGRVERGVVGIHAVVPTLLGHFGLVDRDLPGAAAPFLSQQADVRPVTLRHATAMTADSAMPLDPRLAAVGYRLPASASPAWHAHRIAALARAILARAPDKALALGRSALTLDPDSLAAWCSVALAAVARRDAAALEGVDEAFKRIAPDQIWGALVQGARHLLKGDPAAAIAVLPRDAVDPDDDTLACLAELWLLAHRPSEARRLYARLSARGLSDPRADLGLAACETELRLFIEAEQRLVAVRRRFPLEAQVYERLHLIYRATGRPSDAARMRAIRNLVSPD